MRRILLGFVGATLAAAGAAQAWTGAYDAGLAALRGGKWADARAAFKQAIAYRPEDSANPTMLPGPATERRQWRSGSPYSANFLAAYAGMKAAAGLTGDDKTNLYNEVAGELDTLLNKGQLCTETFWCLNAVYSATANTEKRMALETKFTDSQNKLTWKVDKEGMAAEDVAAANPQSSGGQPNTGTQTPTNTGTTTSTNSGGSLTPAVGRVPVVPTKFALIIGNSESRIQGAAVPYGADDAQLMRETLVTHCGYAEGNIELVINATKDQILSSAKALAERMPAGSTVFLFFAGVGANLDGLDYLAGVDTALATDATTMVAKGEIYKTFMAKEAKMFAFFESPRPYDRGRCFGSEVPFFGRIAQMQATSQGKEIYSTTRGGKSVGLFADAMAAAMGEIRSNQIGISEFGWIVFEKIRGGGGGGGQVPTLPVLIQIAGTSPF